MRHEVLSPLTRKVSATRLKILNSRTSPESDDPAVSAGVFSMRRTVRSAGSKMSSHRLETSHLT